jgi:hypothetical protein
MTLFKLNQIVYEKNMILPCDVKTRSVSLLRHSWKFHTVPLFFAQLEVKFKILGTWTNFRPILYLVLDRWLAESLTNNLFYSKANLWGLHRVFENTCHHYYSVATVITVPLSTIYHKQTRIRHLHTFLRVTVFLHVPSDGSTLSLLFILWTHGRQFAANTLNVFSEVSEIQDTKGTCTEMRRKCQNHKISNSCGNWKLLLLFQFDSIDIFLSKYFPIFLVTECCSVWRAHERDCVWRELVCMCGQP